LSFENIIYGAKLCTKSPTLEGPPKNGINKKSHSGLNFGQK